MCVSWGKGRDCCWLKSRKREARTLLGLISPGEVGTRSPRTSPGFPLCP